MARAPDQWGRDDYALRAREENQKKADERDDKEKKIAQYQFKGPIGAIRSL